MEEQSKSLKKLQANVGDLLEFHPLYKRNLPGDTGVGKLDSKEYYGRYGLVLGLCTLGLIPRGARDLTPTDFLPISPDKKAFVGRLTLEQAKRIVEG